MNRYTRRLTRLEDALSDALVNQFFARLDGCLSAETPGVSDALAEVHKRFADAERAAGRQLAASELLRHPEIDEATGQLVELVCGGIE